MILKKLARKNASQFRTIWRMETAVWFSSDRVRRGHTVPHSLTVYILLSVWSLKSERIKLRFEYKKNGKVYTVKQKIGDFLSENVLKLDHFRGFHRHQTRSTPAENQTKKKKINHMISNQGAAQGHLDCLYSARRLDSTIWAVIICIWFMVFSSVFVRNLTM